MKKISAIVAVMLAAALMLAACSPQITAEVNIDFIVDGGVYATVVSNNGNIKMPADPQKDGCVFDGWFWDKDVWQKPFTLNSLMDAPLSETLRVYAKFTAAENPPSPMSRIERAFFNRYGYEFRYDRFYGGYDSMTFDPALVFFVEGYTDAVKTITISGVEFSHNVGFEIFVWHGSSWNDGTFSTLEEFFAADGLTQANLEHIGQIHNSYYPVKEQAIVNYEFFSLDKSEHFLAYHAGWVYTVESNPYTAYRMRPDKSDKQQIPLDTAMYNSVYHNGWIYYTYDVQPYGGMYIVDNMTLCRMRLDGSQITELATQVGSYVAYGEWIYFISGLNLYRMKTDGSNRTLIAENCGSFIIAGDYIFLTDMRYDNKWIIEGSIVRYNLNGSGKTIILEGVEGNVNIAADYLTFAFAHNGYLYYKIAGNQLHRIKFDGSGSQVVIIPANCYWIDVAFKDEVICYLCIDNSIHTIYSVGLDGTGTIKLGDIIRHSGIYLTLIGDSFYYTTTTGTGSTFKMTLHRLSINGVHSVVYERGLENTYSGIFAHEDTLYMLIS